MQDFATEPAVFNWLDDETAESFKYLDTVPDYQLSFCIFKKMHTMAS